jgi:hypothetical protein
VDSASVLGGPDGPSSLVLSGMTSQPPPGLAVADLIRIQELLNLISAADTTSLLAELARGAPAAMLAHHLRFDHAALLCFPDSLEDAIDQLHDRGGMVTTRPLPSVIVQNRIAAHAPTTRSRLDVQIVHASPRPGHNLEIFMLVCGSGDAPAALIAEERTRNCETHFAFRVDSPRKLPMLRRMLTGLARLTPDGGGFNPQHRGEEGGSTCLYFRGDDQLAVTSWPRRLELITDGYHPQILRAHGVSVSDHLADRSAESALGPTPHDRMLRLLTGAWTTQAIRTAAYLGLADHLGGAALTTATLARRVSADPDRLFRLLRYLQSLGILAASDTLPSDAASVSRDRSTAVQWRLTPLGATLRSSDSGSVHDLALLYGGVFYDSFANLARAITTKGTAFAATFGTEHFDYMAEHPELARLFHRGMAAGSRFFADVPAVIDLSAAERIIDVGGGNGELLSHLLTDAPQARGVLLEAPHVIEVAAKHLARRGILGRCELVEGDFTTSVPSDGDVYVLSRILHDWDDTRCAAILRSCRAAMPTTARLLILERPLPDDDTDSLATPWDLHMLANVGGRERTRAEYRRLLQAAHFDPIEEHRLPLDMSVLVARPAGT